MAINKTLNYYVASIPADVFESTPKAVWAAIAISLATGGGDHLDEAAQAIINEWCILKDNGIVPQPVPAPLRRYKTIED